MNAPKNTHSGTIIYVSILLGTVFSSALLFGHSDNPISRNITDFGSWIASLFGFAGYFPALIASSIIGGIILMCVVCAVTPLLENTVAKKGLRRSKGILHQAEGMSIEDEREELVKRFGQKQSS
jgi:hypothetical protein